MDKRAQTGTTGDGKAAGAVVKKLAPGMPGTLRHLARHGDALVCVRYREDRAGRRRLTTVELVVEARPIPLAYVRIDLLGETDLRRKIMAAGGTWDAARKLWRLPTPAVRALKLTNRVVTDHS